MDEIIPAYLQTKDWRKQCDWYHGGKHNECEIYQRNLVEHITAHSCVKSYLRINLRDKQIYDKKYPMKDADGFDYTEDFDGNIQNKFYVNLKMICDSGGAQTRTLREVYHFVESQLDHLVRFGSNDKYFVNILDGDESHKSMPKFSHLLELPEYTAIKKYVFVGDMSSFRVWWIQQQL
jgi:hypothetical protein